jgi:P27 family predicted phage terminase small subunit
VSGPPPKPSHIKLLEGNPGRRPLNAKEPKPKRGIPRCPAHLSARAKGFWKRIGPQLDKMGVLTVADESALELMCDAYAEFWEARTVIIAGGATYTTTTESGDTMYRARPEVSMAADAWRRVSAMLSQFGLTPAARTKVKSSETETVDPMDAFLSGSKTGKRGRA